MPLENAAVGTPGFSRNIATEVKAGKPQKQAVAIAYSKARGDASPKGKIDGISYEIKNAPMGGKDRYYPKLIGLKGRIQTGLESKVSPTVEGAVEIARAAISTHKKNNPYYYSDAKLDSIQSLADELFCKADAVACGIETEAPKGEAIVGRKADAGERTVKKSVLEQKLRDGTWEMVWEPDRNGRATVKINGKQQTVRIADTAVADRARPSAEVLKEMKTAERDLARLRETGDTPMAQRLALRKVHALEDEYMESVHMERRGARVDASVSSMSGTQLIRHGEELAREKKRLTEKLRGAKSKGDEDRIKSELAALRKQIDEWHRETMRGDAGGSEWIVEGKRNSGESRRVKMIVTAASEREARDKAHQKGWDITYSATRKDSSRGDASDTQVSAALREVERWEERKKRATSNEEMTRVMNGLQKARQHYQKVSRSDAAPTTTIDSLISDAEQLFGRADAVQTGRWDSSQRYYVQVFGKGGRWVADYTITANSEQAAIREAKSKLGSGMTGVKFKAELMKG